MPDTISRFADEHLFLSSSAYSPISLPMREGRREFLSVVHAFNCAKSLDPHDRAKVAAAATPEQAWARGQGVTLRPNWDEAERYRVMDTCLRAKFAPGSQLADQLLSTAEALLIDGNAWHDNHWGDCRCGRTACQAPGQNVLGRMLMSLRFELRSSSDMMTPLSEMTGVPGLCRVPLSQVPDELLAVVTRQPDLAAMLSGTDVRVVLARLLEILVPPIAASQARRGRPRRPPTLRRM